MLVKSTQGVNVSETSKKPSEGMDLATIKTPWRFCWKKVQYVLILSHETSTFSRWEEISNLKISPSGVFLRYDHPSNNLLKFYTHFEKRGVVKSKGIFLQILLVFKLILSQNKFASFMLSLFASFVKLKHDKLFVLIINKCY